MFHASEGHYLQVDDVMIHYDIIGDSGGEPLLLLHGGLGSSADFNGIAAELGKTYRLIAVDFRGHGKSTLGAAKLTYSRHAEDVEAVLDHIGCEGAAVLGFSDGGIVGYRLAMQSPARVRALVTVGAAWRLIPDDPVTLILSSMTAQGWRARFPDSVRYYEEINPEPDLERLVKAAVALWTDTSDTGYPDERVSEILVPTLIVRGDNDRLFPLREAVELRRRIIPSLLFNIPFAAHAAHDDAPDIFLLGVQDFLRDPHRAG